MPAEFTAFAQGESRMPRPFYFIGGNNEDFESLHSLAGGGEVAPGVHYLGRVGTGTIAGIRLGWLSGIYAPKWLDTPLQEPTTAATRKQAGYFRRSEVDQLRTAREVDLLLTHEWFAATLHHPGGAQTRVACLDEAAEAEGAVLWMEWSGGRATRVGWGIDGHVSWTAAQPWGASRGATARRLP